MRKAAGLLRFYQTSGLQTAARKTGMLKVLPPALTPDGTGASKVPRQQKSRLTEYKAAGPARKRVAFFTGCLMDTVFPVQTKQPSSFCSWQAVTSSSLLFRRAAERSMAIAVKRTSETVSKAEY